MTSLKQINTKYVRAIPLPHEDARPIKGFDICEEAYANIFLCAKKKSGKTSALFKIMKECVVRRTIIYIFCSTAYKDKNWIQIRKYFKDKGMELHVFTSIFEDGQDQLETLVENLMQEAKEREEAEEKEKEKKKESCEEDDPLYSQRRCDDILDRLQDMHLRSTGQAPLGLEEQDEEPTKKRRRSKYLAPEYMIIFDDLSSELKSRSLLSLMKNHRHFKSKLIISSQWLHDLLPQSRQQVDLFLIFKGFPERKLQEIYKYADTGVSFELFCEMYKKATEQKYGFLYVDSSTDSYRRNFDSEFILPVSE